MTEPWGPPEHGPCDKCDGEERDLDADAGALLVYPERIRAVRPLDLELVAEIRARLRPG